MNNAKRLFLISTCAAALSGCMGPEAEFGGAFSHGLGSLFSMKSAKVWLQKVNFVVSPYANDHSPVLVHVIIAHDANLLAHLKTLTAQQYFFQFGQMQRDNPGKFQLYPWEILPGQRVPPTTIKLERMSSEGIIVFARYRYPGPHRFVVGSQREITINLGPQTFNVTSVR